MNTKNSLISVYTLRTLGYCERLFYLEEVEGIQVTDAQIYSGRTLHEKLDQNELNQAEWTNFELSCEDLELKGKMDCLRYRDGNLIPYEHKLGKPCKKGKEVTAWVSDVIQITAYGMLLEKETNRSIPEGRIRYHATNTTVKIPLDQAARKLVYKATQRARELQNSIERPPITENERLCIRCSLAPVCLPEEERLVEDPSRKPLRLFPPDREDKTIHVVEPGAYISRSGKTLRISSKNGEMKSYPINDIRALVLHGYPQITTQALYLCAHHDIFVHWVSFGGAYFGGLAYGAGHVQRRLRQYKALSREDTCLNLTRRLIRCKIESSLKYLMRITQKRERSDSDFQNKLSTIRSCLSNTTKASDFDSIRGYEGLAARAYFEIFFCLFRKEVPKEMKTTQRNRRPPKDRLNALLSFGYSLLYQTILQAIMVVGLEPSIGFFHTPRSSAYPLVLDLMEIFRLPLWDLVVLGSINRLQWDPSTDFNVTKGKVWLSSTGRKKAIELFEKRLEEKWKHPVIGHSLAYTRLVELEIRLLEKEWTGQVGLFAKMRLR